MMWILFGAWLAFLAVAAVVCLRDRRRWKHAADLARIEGRRERLAARRATALDLVPGQFRGWRMADDPDGILWVLGRAARRMIGRPAADGPQLSAAATFKTMVRIAWPPVRTILRMVALLALIPAAVIISRPVPATSALDGAILIAAAFGLVTGLQFLGGAAVRLFERWQTAAEFFPTTERRPIMTWADRIGLPWIALLILAGLLLGIHSYPPGAHSQFAVWLRFVGIFGVAPWLFLRFLHFVFTGRIFARRGYY